MEISNRVSNFAFRMTIVLVLIIAVGSWMAHLGGNERLAAGFTLMLLGYIVDFMMRGLWENKWWII